MEKFNSNPSENNKSQPDKSLHIDIFRHGHRARKQDLEKPSIENADDLTPEGVEYVKKSAAELADLIKPEEEVVIWASPFGRTLHTAKLVAEVLEQKGVQLRKKGTVNETGIKVFDELVDVKNFSLETFLPLINGGWFEFAGKKFFIDKNLTNPKNLNKTYYMENGLEDIDPKAKEQWPEEYVREIEGFEKFLDVTKRMIKPLSRLKKIGDKPYRVIIVTHDSLTGFIANVFSGGAENGIDQGDFINLDREEGKLVATKVGKLKDGDTKTDVVDEFNRRHNPSPPK